MRRIQIFYSFLMAAALLVAGCATEEPTDDTDAAADTASMDINYTGDFSGPLGLQLWSIREYMQQDIPGTLAWVREQGFEEVELAGTYNLSPAQFRAQLDSAGLQATAMHAPFDRMRDSLNVVLDEAEALGVEYVGVAWIPHEEGQPFTVDMARETAARFNTWGQAATERGLKFFYHTHGYEFEPASDGEVPFDVLMEETDPEDVTYEMDVFWVSHPGVDAAALLRKYPNRWALMHIKDMKEGTPTGDYSGHAPAEAQVPVGSGQIDYAAVLAAAEEVGVRRYYVEDESPDPRGNIPTSVTWLESAKY
ncbi:MAG TPA: sugar phosphate isomerase/epimerase [Rhodothermales bacterium]|nr:sugar phosphate isomerase/epimerase [Rhodothermales bacterium]